MFLDKAYKRLVNGMWNYATNSVTKISHKNNERLYFANLNIPNNILKPHLITAPDLDNRNITCTLNPRSNAINFQNITNAF